MGVCLYMPPVDGVLHESQSVGKEKAVGEQNAICFLSAPLPKKKKTDSPSHNILSTTGYGAGCRAALP